MARPTILAKKYSYVGNLCLGVNYRDRLFSSVCIFVVVVLFLYVCMYCNFNLLCIFYLYTVQHSY